MLVLVFKVIAIWECICFMYLFRGQFHYTTFLKFRGVICNLDNRSFKTNDWCERLGILLRTLLLCITYRRHFRVWGGRDMAGGRWGRSTCGFWLSRSLKIEHLMSLTENVWKWALVSLFIMPFQLLFCYLLTICLVFHCKYGLIFQWIPYIYL